MSAQPHLVPMTPGSTAVPKSCGYPSEPKGAESAIAASTGSSKSPFATLAARKVATSWVVVTDLPHVRMPAVPGRP